MEIHHCPFCNNSLDCTYAINHKDYSHHCKDGKHTYVKRISDNKILDSMKIRISDNNCRYYLKISFKNNYVEVWTSNENERIRLDNAFYPDFDNENLLLQKIKTILLMS